jgi:hypothetical protein
VFGHRRNWPGRFDHKSKIKRWTLLWVEYQVMDESNAYFAERLMERGNAKD